MNEIVLRAKLRKWQDKDLSATIRRLNLQQGEMSHLVRVGFVLALQQRQDLKLFERLDNDNERG